MKWLGKPSPFHLFTNPCVINRFIFGQGVVIYYIHGCRVSTYNCYLHGSRSRANSDYIHGCRVSTYKIAVIQEPNRLYTLLPGVYKNRYLHGNRSRAKSAIYIAAGCIHKTVIYTAVIQEPNRLYTLLPGVYKKSLFTRQPFKSQIGYIHCCRVYT